MFRKFNAPGINKRSCKHLSAAMVILLIIIVSTIPTSSTLVNVLEPDSMSDFKWTTSSNSTEFKGDLFPFMILPNFATNKWLDESGNGNDGYIYGAEVAYQWSDEGTYGLNFEGFPDFVSCGNNTSLIWEKSFTIEAWVKPNQKNTHATIASKEDYVNSRGWLLLQMGGTDWYFRVYNGTSSQSVSVPNSVTLGKFQQIVVTYNGEYLKLFKNGQEIASLGLSNWLMVQTDKDLLIGARSTVSNQNFNGTINNVRIYSRALNASEVEFSYEHEFPMNSRDLLLDLTFRNLTWVLERSEDGLIYDAVKQQRLDYPIILWSENNIGHYYYRAKFTGDLYYGGGQFTDIREVNIVDKNPLDYLAKGLTVCFSFAAFSLLLSSIMITKKRSASET